MTEKLTVAQEKLKATEELLAEYEKNLKRIEVYIDVGFGVFVIAIIIFVLALYIK